MKYLEKIGLNAKKAFEELKSVNHNKIKLVLNTYNTTILKNKKMKNSDHLGSYVFIIKSQNFKKKISKETNIKNYACDNCKGSRFKEDRCILIKSAFVETRNISAVSRRLGVSRTTIYKHLQ